jgi:hypothetical protein
MTQRGGVHVHLLAVLKREKRRCEEVGTSSQCCRQLSFVFVLLSVSRHRWRLLAFVFYCMITSLRHLSLLVCNMFLFVCLNSFGRR